ncbi:hypothetical protein ACCS92_38310, partial [Rhizobium ruizarguesonis]
LMTRRASLAAPVPMRIMLSSVSRGQIREALAILEAMRIVERRAKSGIYLTTTEASVEAMALFASAGVPIDPILIYETVELRKIHE